MPDDSDHSGMAALTICEALLLAMNDHGLLAGHQIEGLLRDAAATHENAAGPDPGNDSHRAAAALINRIIADGYPVGVPVALPRAGRPEKTDRGPKPRS